VEPLSDERAAELEQTDRAQWAEQAPYIADFFTARELRLVRNCVEYRDGDPAGLPGHNLMLLVAKLATNDGWTQGERLDELIEMAERNEAEQAVRVEARYG
jgi:hypothetical protein